MVLLYHLLWELTHVVFEHPGLLDAEPAVHGRGLHHLLRRGPGGRGPDGPRPTARPRSWLAGRPETVDVSLVDPVAPGDLVLVHAGVALTTCGRLRRRPGR